MKLDQADIVVTLTLDPVRASVDAGRPAAAIARPSWGTAHKQPVEPSPSIGFRVVAASADADASLQRYSTRSSARQGRSVGTQRDIDHRVKAPARLSGRKESSRACFR